MESNETVLSDLIAALITVPDRHAPDSALYRLLKQVARKEVERLFSRKEAEPRPFGPFGEIIFPYHKMGAIDSLDLFGLDELIMFGFYWRNRERYRRVADIGANIGLHSLVLGRCGYEVRSYEPDPAHFALLKRNLERNGSDRVTPVMAAVSRSGGVMEFVRVLGNTTGSHLAGSKQNPYGELERFPVRVEAIGPILEWADLAKIDAEGHEREILLATDPHHWRACDAIVEIGTGANARAVFDHFKTIGVGMFAQKTGWQPVERVEQMPTSYHDGSLFVSREACMPWT